MAALCRALAHPERAFRSILVAGTNGKGSVAAMIERALRAAGLKTGRFTSPHLVDLTERFAVAGRPVTGQALACETATLRTTVEAMLDDGRLAAPPTFFEATTALAFMLFSRAAVEIAVLEVGMGGRYDATNIVTPVAAVVTNVALDHQQYLGRTLAAIAAEKAGIVKPGGLVVTGETRAEPLAVVRAAAIERRARLIEAPLDVDPAVTLEHGRTRLTLETPVRRYGPLTLALTGRHQAANAVVAVRLLETLDGTAVGAIPAAAIRAGLTDTRWPGRLERVDIAERGALLLDAAHNAAGAAALARYLAECHPRGVPLVLAAMRDKDAPAILRALRPAATRILCPRLAAPRALPAATLAAIASAHCPDLPCAVAESPTAAVEQGWSAGNPVCAAGSVVLIGDLLRAYAIDPAGRNGFATAPE